jgi:dUTP pyrophosphatase
MWFSAEKKVIPAKGKGVIDTQISMAVPPGTYGRVAPRSGLGEGHLEMVFFPRHSRRTALAAKFGIDTGAGVIDADYRGILYILLFNLGDKDFEGPFPSSRPRRLTPAQPLYLVNEGDRVAQLVIERIYTPEISVVTVSRLFPCAKPLNDSFAGLGRD